MCRICITGANGYIGKHLVEYLTAFEKDCELILVGRSLPSFAVDSIRCVSMDILGGGIKLYERLERPDVLIHLAWQDGFNHFAESHLRNVAAHYTFLKNMIDGGCNSVAVMGSMHEVGYYEGAVTADTPCSPLSPYGIAKNTLRQAMMLYAQDKPVSLKWLRAYYITGDDLHNHSIFTKILQLAIEGRKNFPFTDGQNKYDFLDIHTVAMYIAKAAMQNNVTGIINVCSGKPVALKDKIAEFIHRHHLSIVPEFGAYPKRKYDSPAIWGDPSLINQIIHSSVKLS